MKKEDKDILKFKRYKYKRKIIKSYKILVDKITYQLIYYGRWSLFTYFQKVIKYSTMLPYV